MMPLFRPVPLALLTLILASCGAAPSPSPLSPSAGDTPPGGEMTLVLDELNAVRAGARDCGTQQFAATTPVSWNAQLAAAAHAHAQDMADRNYFDHVSSDGRVLKNRVEAAGYLNWRELGENIAAGFTASEVIQGWLDSKDHCMTLMDPLLREVGIAVVVAGSENEFANYWVQDFGTR